MIFLYSKLDVQNKGEGLGNLQDFVEEPIVTWNASGYLELEFKYFMHGDLAEHMIPDAKLKTRIHSNDEVHHLFTVYEVEPDYIENTVQVRAEMTLLHELKDRVVPAGTMRGTANEMIMFVKNKMDRDYPFVITGNTDKTVFIEHDNISAYELIFGEDGILKRTGAEIGFTDRGIRLSNRIGTIHRDELRESDFVTNLTVNESQGEDFVTRIIPFTTAMFDRPVRDGERYNRETIETPTYGTPVISPNITNKMYKVRTKFVEYRNEPTEVPKYYNYETERGTETLEMSEYIYEDVTALNHDASTFFEDNLGIDEPTTTITIETLGLAKGYYTYLRYLNRYDIVTIYVEPKPYLTNNSETYVVQVNETVYEPLSDNLVSIGFTNESTSLENAYRNVNEGRISDQQLQAELQKERLRDLEDRLVNYVYNHDGFRLEFGNVLPPPDEYREGDLYYLETGEGIDIYQLINGAWEFLVGQSTREIIEGKIEEIEKQAEELTKDIEASNQKADEAKEEAGLAKSAVDAFGIITQETADKMVDVEQSVATAETNASDALAEASEAKTQAGQAVIDARTAIDNAREAQADSKTAIDNSSLAQVDASKAINDASKAQSDAKTAMDNASLAQTDAQTAIDNAQTALSTAGNADSKAGQAIAKANAIPTTVTDIIADKNLVNGSYVDTKIDGATGAWSQELVRVEGKIPTEIGGRNYAKGTSKEFTYVLVGEHSGSLVNGGVTSQYIYTLEELGVQVGDTMTASMYVGESEEGFGGGFRIDDQSTNHTYSTYEVVKNGYTNVTFTILEGSTDIRLYTMGQGQSGANGNFRLPVKELKLEKGNVATDWTPAPEDLYSQEDFKLFNTQYTQDVAGMTGRLTTVENTKLDDSTFQTFKQSEYQVTADKVANTMTRVDTVEGEITTQGTVISQQATAIASKADKTVVDTLSGTVSNQGTLITQNATDISSKAELELVNQIKGTVDTHTTEISQNATAITSKASQKEVDTLSGTVSTHDTTIEQQATSIASKADKSVVDTLSGTVSTHGTTLTQQANAISSKAEQVEVDTVKGTVSSHTSTLSQHAKDISARLTQSQVNSLVSDKGYSTVSYVDTQMSATAEGIRTEMTAIEGKIPTEIGGRNYAKGTSKEYAYTRVGEYSGRLTDGATSQSVYTLEELGVQAGDIMTVSMYVGESEEGYGGGFRIDDQGGQNKYSTYKIVKNGYVSETFTILEGSTEIRLYTTGYVQSGASRDYDLPTKELKLEKGNIPTDWTPAPEDMLKQNDFNIFKAEYEQSASGWSAELLQIEQADYASKTWSNQTFATPQSVTTQLQSYAKSTDLNGLVTETSLTNKNYITSSAVNTLLGSYAKTTDLNGMVTETTLSNKNFATASSVNTLLTSYAKTTDLNGLATESYVSNQMSTTAEAIRTELTSVEGKIDGLEIGGRNLIGHFNIIKGGWVGADGSISVSTIDRVATEFIAIPTNTKNITFSYDGQDYPSSSVKFAVGLYDAEFGFINRLTSGDTSTPKTFTIPENVAYIRLSYPTALRSYDDYAKLEKGNVATDWTPAPEDVFMQNEFNTFKAEYDQSAKGWSAKLLQIEQANYATRTWSNQTFATPQSVSTQLQSYAKTTDLNGLVTETALANKSYITSSAVNTLLNSYAKTTALNGMVTETTLATKNFITAGSVNTLLTSYAKTNTVPTVTQFNSLKNSYDRMEQTIGTNGEKIANMVMTDSMFNTRVLESIDIGGRNYALGTTDKMQYQQTVGTWSGDMSDNASKTRYTLADLDAKVGDVYTASIYIGAGGGFGAGLRIDNQSGSKHNSNRLSHGYASVTFEVDPSDTEFRFYYSNNSGNTQTYYIEACKFKIEKGNKRTDWTPSPLDMATSQQVSDIKQTADSIQALVGTTNDSVASAVMTSNLWETEVSKVIDSELEQEYETVEGDVPFYEYTTPRSLLQGDRSMTIYLPVNADTTVDGKQVIVDVTYEVSEGGQGNHAAYIQYGDIESGEALMYSSSNTVTFVIYVPPGTRNGTIMDLHTNIVDSGNYTWATITNITVSTVEEIEVLVHGANTGAIGSKITQLYDMINLSVLGKEGALSRIAMGEEGIQIDGKLLHITAKTYIDNAVIKSAMIDTLDAGKITTGELNASLIKVVNLDANSITGNEASFIQALFSGTTSTLQITSNGVNILDNSGKSSTHLDSSGIEFSREGINLGKLQYVTNTADSGDLNNMHGFSMRPNRNSYFGISYFPSITATESTRSFAVSGRTGNVYISGLIKPSEEQVYGLDITWGTITNIGTNVRIYNHNRTGGIQINNGDLSYLSTGGWRSLNGWLK